MIIIKTKVLLPQTEVILTDLSYHVLPFVFLPEIFLNYLVFKYFGIEYTWRNLFQTLLMRTKIGIYIFIDI